MASSWPSRGADRPDAPAELGREGRDAHERRALDQEAGLARTVRGPSMSATPGMILLDGVATVDGERVFVLKMVQGRDPGWVNRPFFVRFDAQATWFDDLRPAFGGDQFFFEPYVGAM